MVRLLFFYHKKEKEEGDPELGMEPCHQGEVVSIRELPFSSAKQAGGDGGGRRRPEMAAVFYRGRS